jgi:HPt (histidine-containing phosphotransfer) domain-containing protein
MNDSSSENIFSRHEAPAESNARDIGPHYLNVNYLREISAQNADFVKDMLTMFREESGDFVAMIQEHFRQRDFYSLKRVAHAMKPTGSYIGVDALTDLIASLEKAAPSGDIPQVAGLIMEIEILIKKLLEEIETYLTLAYKS